MSIKALGITAGIAALAFAALATIPNKAEAAPHGRLVKVCVAWAKGAPGTFAGPCIKYSYRWAGTPSPIR
jgi:hypothetical protein